METCHFQLSKLLYILYHEEMIQVHRRKYNIMQIQMLFVASVTNGIFDQLVPVSKQFPIVSS